jgi:hypothetical protein
MSEQEKQAYMDNLMLSMLRYMSKEQMGNAEACLNNYESKLRLGWPHANTLIS